MKKTLTVLLIALCLVLPAFADNITKFGMNASYNALPEKPEMGMYMTSLFIDSRAPRPVNLGFGMRIDMNATLPTDRMNVDFISGLAIDFKLKHNWGIDVLLGPSFGVTTIFSTNRDEGMFVGAGADISATYYLDNERTSGINIGISGNGGMYLPEDSGIAATPTGKVTGYFGFTFRSNYHSMFYGSQDIYITL